MFWTPDLTSAYRRVSLPLFALTFFSAAYAPAELVASYDGFNLHVAAAFEAHERLAFERFCRYTLRGPLATSRLTEGPEALRGTN